MAVTGDGDLACGFLSGGNRNDVKAAPELVEEVYDCHALGDRGYDSDKFRRFLESNNNVPVIPGCKNWKVAVEYDEERYERRGIIERIFAKLREGMPRISAFHRSFPVVVAVRHAFIVGIFLEIVILIHI